jgi:DSF synthase
MINSFIVPNLKYLPVLTGHFDKELKVYYDSELSAIWMRWYPDPRPCYTMSLLSDIGTLYDLLEQNDNSLNHDETDCLVKYVVGTSAFPGVFNLGGDLEYFEQCIKTQDRERLWQYGHAAMLISYRTYTLPGIVTIALVQGTCLGGGFESALSSHLLVAERSATFGFPEIKFNLFPGMGAYSFLERRVGQKLTEQLLCEGKIYTADEMYAMGLVDVVVEDGEGITAVETLIKQRRNYQNGLMAIGQARRRVQRLDYEEMKDIVSIWTDAALRLTSRDLNLMRRLVTRQKGL